MSESTQNNRGRNALIVAVLALCFSLASLYSALAPRPQAKKGGTWVCQDATGGHIAVINPANCGPDDLVLWCTNWVIDDPASGAGHCAD